MSRSSVFRRELVQPWIVAVFAVGFSLLVMAAFAIPYGIEARARGAMLHDLGQLSIPFTATLDRRPADDPDELVRFLKQTRFVLSHHSSPQDFIEVRITDGKIAIELRLARDSRNVDEYWVLRPGRNLVGNPLHREAGRIIDRRLTQYLQARGF